MSNKYIDDNFFRYFISGMDSKLQAELSYMYAHNKLAAQAEHRREMEQMKREIEADILSRLSATVDVQEILDNIEELRRDIADLRR